jgi:hypothetical protein
MIEPYRRWRIAILFLWGVVGAGVSTALVFIALRVT